MKRTRTTPAKSVLLTGFDPFDRSALNPSWLAVQRLHGTRIAGHRVHALQLPTEYARAPVLLRRAIRELRPAMVLCVGQAGGRAAISLERVAVNLADARIPDNAGAQPCDQLLVDDAPAAYFARLPLKAMAAALRKAGIPVELSQTAGLFVCNAIFFHLCHTLATRFRTTRGGFIHVPYLPEQVAERHAVPSMDLETMVRALRICTRIALAGEAGSAEAEGATH